MYYLYKLDSRRVLHRVMEDGHHVCTPSRSGMDKIAARISRADSGGVCTVDTAPDLHNTRDGKPRLNEACTLIPMRHPSPAQKVHFSLAKLEHAFDKKFVLDLARLHNFPLGQVEEFLADLVELGALSYSGTLYDWT